jgi:hypothetical protein
MLSSELRTTIQVAAETKTTSIKNGPLLEKLPNLNVCAILVAKRNQRILNDPLETGLMCC